MPSKDSKREKAREVVDILEEISELLVSRDESAAIDGKSLTRPVLRIRSSIVLNCLYAFR